MARWKPPPPAKVYEAFSAVGDGRVSLVGPDTATVTSSGGDKAYEVRWSDGGRSVTSNDNASYWQGYLGYPIIAVLIAQGRLHVDDDVPGLLAGVGWHDLNKRFRRDYDAAVASALEGLAASDAERITRAAASVLAQLGELELERPGRGPRPPAVRREP